MARRPTNPRDAAEAAFKSATAPERVKEAPPAIPHGREQVSLRIDRDVLAHFQEEGPGWQDRINAALRRSAGL
ncbi:MAG TPA: BrnA antitoxin family protein [Aurantimonas sp.]|uniref:BrnA antitoxin family protein n=1 Tax=Aurantimonas marianensis TaxID=2920428 RepID=A0A9X2H952_9HYPH|nr:BrnA antitoxin family protein [Aurantimonas marianensis]MCP3056611.1 BrnA antitoxin family protein [Aurantimonas marianensis]